MPDWLRAEVVDGLQALISLRLDRAPAADMVVLTANIWERAFERQLGRNAIEEIDAPRIREGFDDLFHRVKEWPAPSDVIERMPPRRPVPALPAPEPTKEQHRESVKRVKGMVNSLLKSWEAKK